MISGLARRILVVTLVAAMAGVFSLSSTWGNGDASWGGRVFDADGVTPRGGVVVNLVNELGDVAARSGPTPSDGSFVIDRAPAGDYAVLIETPDGAFLGGTPMSLEPGTNVPAALHLRNGVSQRDMDYGLGSGQQGLKKWVKWTIASAIGVVAIFLILEAGDDTDEEPASPF